MSAILNNVLTVDPGEFTAVAHWKGTLFPTVHKFCYSSIKGYVNRFNYMWNQFEIIIEHSGISKVYIESTVFYEGDLKSETSAKRGDLFKLGGLTHGYCALCNKYGVKWELIQASQWKGQMSKEATANRIRLINGAIYETDHVTDAVGIGFGIMGMLTWRKEK